MTRVRLNNWLRAPLPRGLATLAVGIGLVVLAQARNGVRTSCAPGVWLAGMPLVACSDMAPIPGTAGNGTTVPKTSALAAPAPRFGLVEVDPRGRTVSLPARVNMVDGLIEYALVTDYGKAHESLLVTEARPIDIQSALLLLNASPAGTNAVAAAASVPPAASAVRIGIRTSSDASAATTPLEAWIRLRSRGDTGGDGLTPGAWLFNGSYLSAEGFAAHFEGSIISLIRDPAAIVNNPRPSREDDELHEPRASAVPGVGTAVTVVIQVGEPRA